MEPITQLIHRLEYLALALALEALAVWHWEQLGWAFWVWLAAPDVLGLVPASLLGPAPERGALPPRGAWLYNAWHTFTLPLACGGTLALLTQSVPWPLLGWLLHSSLDRTLGYGLRDAAGRQGLL
jgi:hypothetical protein